MQYSDRINLAIRRAATAHDGQYRRNSATPYVAHPFAVALISQRYISNEDVFIACLLHDVLEDVPERVYSADDIYHDFGDEVLKIIKDVTEPDVKAEAWRAWQVRKDSYIAHLDSVNDTRPLIVSASDKIHNMSEMIRDYSTNGSRIWNAFYADKERELWFFGAVLEVLKKKPIPEQAIKDYEEKYNDLKIVVKNQ